MLGEKKPLWRRRRANFLALERAVAPQRARGERHTDAEHAVIERKLAEHRFEVSKGRIRPPT